MNKSKAILGFLANFLLGALGVVGIGWLILYKFPKAAVAVYTVGGICILMCLWSAYDEMNKKMKKKKDVDTLVDVKAVDIAKDSEEKPNKEDAA